MSQKKSVTTKSWLSRLRVAIASLALAAAVVGAVTATSAPDGTESDQTAQVLTSGAIKSGAGTFSRSITWSSARRGQSST